MFIELARRNGVLDDQLIVDLKVNRRGGEQLGVEAIEFSSILISPQGEALDSTYHPKSVLQSIHDLLTAKAGGLSSSTERLVLRSFLLEYEVELLVIHGAGL